MHQGKVEDFGANVLLFGLEPANAAGVIVAVGLGILQRQLGFANAPHAAQGGDGQAITLVKLGMDVCQLGFATDKLHRATAGQVVGKARKGDCRWSSPLNLRQRTAGKIRL
jgi:hypothetical protein